LKSTSKTTVRQLSGGTYRISGASARSAATGRFVAQARKNVAGTRVTKALKPNPAKQIAGYKVTKGSIASSREKGKSTNKR
jgi:hypothetical protein